MEAAEDSAPGDVTEESKTKDKGNDTVRAAE